MEKIYVGDNGTLLRCNIKQKGEAVRLIGVQSIEITIKSLSHKVVKLARLTDIELGKCEITLSREDIPITGRYYIQPKIDFQDGKSFRGDIQKFEVEESL